MNWLPRLVARMPAGIHTKLLVAFFSIVVMFIALGAEGLIVLRSSDQRAADLVGLQHKITAYRQLQENATEQLYAVTSAFLMNDERSLDATMRRLNQFAYDFDRAQFVGRDEAELLDKIEADYAEFIRIGGQVVELLRNNDSDAARKLQLGSAVPLADRIERYTYTLVNRAEADMIASADASRRAYLISQYAVIAVALVSVLMALLLGYAFSRSLIDPVKRMDARFRDIAHGEFGGRLEIPNRDELGNLGNGLNQMSEELDRLYRQLEAVSQHKSEFLATMSHEIRTPMNAVIGMTHLLLDTELSRQQRDFCITIRDSADTLLTIINDILDFSKVEAGRLELEEQPFELREAIEGAFDLVTARAAEKGLELAYLVEPGTPEGVVGDITRLRQVLLNLLNNAVKFTEQGEVVVTVEARPAANPDNPATDSLYEFHFVVRDTGIGIPAERLDRLFKSFSQVDASTTRRYGGTGLGLAISKRLCELMGGEIRVESETGQGTMFHFTIPLPVTAAPVRAELHQAAPDLRGKRLLIVDDNATNRRILTLQAQSWHMQARATGSPMEALQWIQRGDAFDVAILDMHMPDMDGLQLATEIRRRRDAGTLPLVMLSSLGARSELPEQGARVEFAAFLSKPIKPSQLFNTLVTLFSGRPVRVIGRETGPQSLFDATLAQQLPLSILLVDDHVTNQKLALLILQRLGYRADVAGNGLEVLDALERQRYDVIFMDVQMPEMDGLEATRDIRRRWPERGPHIIAMTANVMSGDREQCLAAGMDDYIGKPIQVEELVRALKKYRDHRDGSVTQNPRGEVPMSDTVLDPQALEALLAVIGGETAMLAELIGSFLNEAPKLFAGLRDALTQDDAGKLRMGAHTIKSSARDFGALTLARQCQQLEDRARNGELEDAPDRVAALEAEYQRVQMALEAAVIQYREVKQVREA